MNVISGLIKDDINVKVGQSYKKADKQLPTIIVVRHGETAYNSSHDKSQERLRGWLNVPLASEGYVQAEKLGQYFNNLPISRIITSDLQRAVHTAETIQRYTNVAINTDQDLRPFNLGIYMGKSVDEYVPALLSHIKNIDEIPEGSTESFRHFLTRFYNKVKTAMDEAIEHPENGAIILIAHSRNTRAFRDLILEGSEIKVEDMKKDTLLQEKDPTPTGHFVAAQFNNDDEWELVELPEQEALDQ